MTDKYSIHVSEDYITPATACDYAIAEQTKNLANEQARANELKKIELEILMLENGIGEDLRTKMNTI